jgi:hypothetical protein
MIIKGNCAARFQREAARWQKDAERGSDLTLRDGAREVCPVADIMSMIMAGLVLSAKYLF